MLVKGGRSICISAGDSMSAGLVEIDSLIQIQQYTAFSMISKKKEEATICGKDWSLIT
jgi:hypothetical protein